MPKTLTESIRYLKGIGPQKAKLFAKIGINTIEDLLYYFPRRYEDRTKFIGISELKEGQATTIKAQVLSRAERRSFRRRGFSILEAVVADTSGKIHCVWFNQPYLKQYFKVGIQLILFGKTERYGTRLQMSSPEFEIISSDAEASLSIGRIVPIYALAQGITQRHFRQVVKSSLDGYLTNLHDFLPFDLRSRNHLLNLAQSFINIHFPQNDGLRKQAYDRLAFEEFFIFQLPLAIRKLKKQEKIGIAHKFNGALIDGFLANLPFQLTPGQERALEEIESDMRKPQVMQRLLQGDVGSGKTIVAVIASIAAIQGGYQAAFMVPTEILAKQHYEKIRAQASGLRYRGKNIELRLLTSSLDKKAKDRVYQEIKEGEADLVIGTHALLEERVQFKNLGLAVIDEQHKFGVGQRALLPQKGSNPDILIMTATPIPRTLAITMYGDLEISVIDDLPPGRGRIKTLRFGYTQKEEAYKLTRQELTKGFQGYVIYPVIEESFVLDMDGAKKLYSRLKAEDFKDFKLGLIHGRLKEEEQDKIMAKFKNKEIDLLVSTTILEVGIDVPEATCMIVEHAERFGLSQLHQLRGRVGRGCAESFCFLISDPATEDARARLEAMVNISDGFKIAEEDLKIRGPGEFFGRRQHGLTELKIANPLTQLQLLKKAREEAINLVAKDPDFSFKQNLPLKEKLLQRFPEYEKLMAAG